MKPKLHRSIEINVLSLRLSTTLHSEQNRGDYDSFEHPSRLFQVAKVPVAKQNLRRYILAIS
jgi:hypothetical protein